MLGKDLIQSHRASRKQHAEILTQVSLIPKSLVFLLCHAFWSMRSQNEVVLVLEYDRHTYMAVSVFSKASRSICGQGLGRKLFIITGVGELKPSTQNGPVVWLENILLVTCSVGFSMGKRVGRGETDFCHHKIIEFPQTEIKEPRLG